MKKIIIGSLIGWLFFFSTNALATEDSAYDSNGVTSFYGVYEKPDEKPKKPDNKHGNKQKNQQGEKILPATGSDHYNYIQIIGGFYLVVVLIILSKRSIHNEKDFSNTWYRYY